VTANTEIDRHSELNIPQLFTNKDSAIDRAIDGSRFSTY
jgi:hypothetical protein